MTAKAASIDRNDAPAARLVPAPGHAHPCTPSPAGAAAHDRLRKTSPRRIPTCPLLGLPDDPVTRFSFPSVAHRCRATDRPRPIELGHQATFCLGGTYPECAWYRAAVASGARRKPGRVNKDGRDRLAALQRQPGKQVADSAHFGPVVLVFSQDEENVHVGVWSRLPPRVGAEQANRDEVVAVDLIENFVELAALQREIAAGAGLPTGGLVVHVKTTHIYERRVGRRLERGDVASRADGSAASRAASQATWSRPVPA